MKPRRGFSSGAKKSPDELLSRDFLLLRVYEEACAARSSYAETLANKGILAEEKRFELLVGYKPTAVFKTAALNRSATPPLGHPPRARGKALFYRSATDLARRAA